MHEHNLTLKEIAAMLNSSMAEVHTSSFSFQAEDGIRDSSVTGVQTCALPILRSKIVLAMLASGIEVEVHHHEVGTAGQTEIDMRFQTLTHMADQMMKYKYVVKNVC